MAEILMVNLTYTWGYENENLPHGITEVICCLIIVNFYLILK